jgi:Protein of unknown function (DUF4446)
VTITEYVLAGGLLLALVWLALLQAKLNQISAARATLTQGLTGEQRLTLEDLVTELGNRVSVTQARLDRLSDGHNKLGEEVAALTGESRYSLQRVGLVRFNPFADTGGDQSFAVAVLDRLGNGFVFSSLHGRGGSRFYAKPLKNGLSSYQLSDEEVEAVKSALGQSGNIDIERAAIKLAT